MARFDDEFLGRMKDDYDIVALIESYGTKLKPCGDSGEMIGLCPIHDDKNPSLVVNRKKNVWNCLGACGCGGDVIQWVMHAEKVSFRHAVELLSNNAVGKAAAGGTKAANVRRLESPIETTAAGERPNGSGSDQMGQVSLMSDLPIALERSDVETVAFWLPFFVGRQDALDGFRHDAETEKASSR